jgi:hypothetical protein
MSTAIGLMSTPVEAVFEDLAACFDDKIVGFGVGAEVYGFIGVHPVAGALVAFGGPDFDEPGGEVAAGCDEKCTGAHGDVGDLQSEDLAAGPEFPFATVSGLQWARCVDERFQGILDDLLGEESGRIVRASAPAQPGFGHVQGPGSDDDRQAAQVGSDQPVKRQ